MAGIGLLAVGALVGLGDDRRFWRWVGVVSCVAAAWIAMNAIWDGRLRHEKILAPLVAVAFWIAMAA